jgi:hypothetical protein
MKDPRDSIMSTNNNKKVSDSNKEETYVDPITGTDVTAGHALQNKRLSDMSETEKDLMYSKQDDVLTEAEKKQNLRFNQGVKAFSGDKELMETFKASLQDDTIPELSEAEKSDIRALSKFPGSFTQNGMSASFTGKLTGDPRKDADLINFVLQRRSPKGSKFVKGEGYNAPDLARLSKFFGKKVKSTDLTSDFYKRYNR